MAGVRWSNGENQAIYPQLLTGQTDLSSVYLPPPILKQWTGVANSHVAVPPSFGYVLGFNSHRYPLSIKEVRQALAYVIPRQQMTEAAFGTTKNGGGVWKKINTGISPSLERLYLTQSQLDQLNPYPVDPDKATRLLRSKGFTKKGTQWLMPNGKPFTLTITVNSATSNQVTSDTSAAKALSDFGIKTDVNATSGAQQDADQHNGDFEIGSFSPNSNSPLGMYASMMGPGANFSATGTYAGKRGIGFGPTMDVPGLGRVDVPAELSKQVSTVPPGAEMKKYTWDWARLVNEQVPYIWYATKNYQFEYSTKNFTNWPPVDANGTSPLWNLAGYNMTAGFSLAIQQGYIVPKS
jgi:peptide/nickel transport system substrate-binding protein